VSAGHSLLQRVRSRMAPLETAPVYVDRSPWQDTLLTALPPRENERLLPDLEPVSLTRGSTVHGPGDRHDFLLFLAADIVSRLCVARGGASTEFALDRRGLEARVCECYAVVRRECDRLLGPTRTVGLHRGSGSRETACLADHGA
jgi:hypothetical protein